MCVRAYNGYYVHTTSYNVTANSPCAHFFCFVLNSPLLAWDSGRDREPHDVRQADGGHDADEERAVEQPRGDEREHLQRLLLTRTHTKPKKGSFKLEKTRIS